MRGLKNLQFVPGDDPANRAKQNAPGMASIHWQPRSTSACPDNGVPPEPHPPPHKDWRAEGGERHAEGYPIEGVERDREVALKNMGKQLEVSRQGVLPLRENNRLMRLKD